MLLNIFKLSIYSNRLDLKLNPVINVCIQSSSLVCFSTLFVLLLDICSKMLSASIPGRGSSYPLMSSFVFGKCADSSSWWSHLEFYIRFRLWGTFFSPLPHSLLHPVCALNRLLWLHQHFIAVIYLHCLAKLSWKFVFSFDFMFLTCCYLLFLVLVFIYLLERAERDHSHPLARSLFPKCPQQPDLGWGQGQEPEDSMQVSCVGGRSSVISTSLLPPVACISWKPESVVKSWTVSPGAPDWDMHTWSTEPVPPSL